jgi:ribosomal protein S18 acetylase RimI-like enzyme
MKNLQIIPATLEDLATLQAIGRKTFVETFSTGNSEENMAAYLEEGFSKQKLEAELRNKNSKFYFALQGEEVIGYLKVNQGDAQTEKQDPNALEIERIYVLQQYHGKQVGLLLYEQALSIAKARKAPYMWLGVWEENPRAIRFYQKLGFVEFGEHIFQLGDEAQRDVLMKLYLQPLLSSKPHINRTAQQQHKSE